MEETTTGVNRLRAMERDNVLMFPVIAVNDATTKCFFDNCHGTGQSTIDGVFRARNTLIAGRKPVVCGYGWCGKDVALRARGLGANVIVTEIDPIRALEAAMGGFSVMPITEAASVGDVFITVTGNSSVLRREHLAKIKDWAVVRNSGHFDVELDRLGRRVESTGVTKDVRTNVDEYKLKNGKRIRLLGEGRLVNLTCAEGRPPSVMDMSFATQALATEFCIQNKGKLGKKAYTVPVELENYVAKHKLESMGVRIDDLTSSQK